jgi:hypothetical protein
MKLLPSHPVVKLLRKKRNASFFSNMELTSTDIHEVLRVAFINMKCTQNIAEVVWILLHETKLFLEAIIEFDLTLFNKFFDVQVETHNSPVISLEVLVCIHGFLRYKFPDIYFDDSIADKNKKYDIFSISVFLEMTDEDFDRMIWKYFNPNNLEDRFNDELILYDRFFESKHVPKLLRMLENCTNHTAFNQVWFEFEEEQL